MGQLAFEQALRYHTHDPSAPGERCISDCAHHADVATTKHQGPPACRQRTAKFPRQGQMGRIAARTGPAKNANRRLAGNFTIIHIELADLNH
jgi:hypothetical protein